MAASPSTPDKTAPFAAETAEASKQLQEMIARYRRMFHTVNTPYPVGQTPKSLIWSLNKAKLYHYEPVLPPEQRKKEPLLLVFALMNRAYILDLRPGHSFVEFMVNHGYDVYLIDWGSAGPEDKDLSLDEYVLDYVVRAIRKMKQHSGSERFNMLGWCIGAILATTYAALRPDDGLHNLMLLTPPLEFSNKAAGNFIGWVNDGNFDVDKLLARYGNMPGELLSYGAKALKPVDSYIVTYLKLWDNLDDPKIADAWQAMNTWINDNIDMAGAFYRQLITEFYQENRLAEGKLTVRGEKVDLARIKANLLMVLAEWDHIVPACQSDAIFPKLGSKDKEILRLPGGHIGLMAGSTALKRTWPRIEEWLGARAK